MPAKKKSSRNTSKLSRNNNINQMRSKRSKRSKRASQKKRVRKMSRRQRGGWYKAAGTCSKDSKSESPTAVPKYCCKNDEIDDIKCEKKNGVWQLKQSKPGFFTRGARFLGLFKQEKD
jgi:hypothetical protein